MPSEATLNFSERLLKLTPSITLEITAKAKALKAAGEDIISFGAGEPDFDTPEPVKQAAIKALEAGDTKYTPAAGTPALKQAIVDKLRRENGLDYSPENIVVSCGAKHSLYNLFQVILNPGDEVIIPSPFWLSYPEMVTLAGGTSVIIEGKEENGFVPTDDEIKAAITPKTKAFILNSPSNPTGAVWPTESVEALGKLAVENEFYIVSDEIYEKIQYEGRKHVATASLGDDIKQWTVTVNGMSKSYSMTGWRLGYIAADEKKIVKLMSGLQSHSTSNPTSFAQAGGIEALKESTQKYVDAMLVKFEERRTLILDEIAKIPTLKAFTPQGAFYVFVNVSGTGMDSLEFTTKALEEAKVAVVPGAAFGAPNHIRLSFAISDEDIKNGIGRLADLLNK
jgi:aspartate aminotransferase